MQLCVLVLACVCEKLLLEIVCICMCAHSGAGMRTGMRRKCAGMHTGLRRNAQRIARERPQECVQEDLACAQECTNYDGEDERNNAYSRKARNAHKNARIPRQECAKECAQECAQEYAQA